MTSTIPNLEDHDASICILDPETALPFPVLPSSLSPLNHPMPIPEIHPHQEDPHIDLLPLTPPCDDAAGESDRQHEHDGHRYLQMGIIQIPFTPPTTLSELDDIPARDITTMPLPFSPKMPLPTYENSPELDTLDIQSTESPSHVLRLKHVIASVQQDDSRSSSFEKSHPALVDSVAAFPANPKTPTAEHPIQKQVIHSSPSPLITVSPSTPSSLTSPAHVTPAFPPSARTRGASEAKKSKLWTEDEDQKLRNLVQSCNADQLNNAINKTWRKIATSIQGRTGKQCRERWLNQLKPGIRRGPWTEEEEQTLAEVHASLGNSWVLISTYLPGRTENCVKNHWNSMQRKKARKQAAVINLDRKRKRAGEENNSDCQNRGNTVRDKKDTVGGSAKVGNISVRARSVTNRSPLDVIMPLVQHHAFFYAGTEIQSRPKA